MPTCIGGYTEVNNKKRNLEYIIHDTEEELLSDPLLFKMPIVRFEGKATAGHDPDIWKNWIK